jgi:GAF domain-containing protein
VTMYEMRERRLAETFVELADTLVDEFDVIDFLSMLTARCVELLDVSAAGVLLVGEGGQLQPVASSDEAALLVELFELQSDDGPCLQSYRTGEPLVNIGIVESEALWPLFAARVRAAGFVVVHALPLRLRRTVIGALNLFVDSAHQLTEGQVALAQAMADAATIGILQQRTIQRGEQVSAQLQGALTSRILIEQAKGVLAERRRIHVDEAFAVLRGYARDHNMLLSELASTIVQGSGDYPDLFARPGEETL